MLYDLTYRTHFYPLRVALSSYLELFTQHLLLFHPTLITLVNGAWQSASATKDYVHRVCVGVCVSERRFESERDKTTLLKPLLIV